MIKDFDKLKEYIKGLKEIRGADYAYGFMAGVIAWTDYERRLIYRQDKMIEDLLEIISKIDMGVGPSKVQES
jgi:hypothetical protein